MAFEWFGESYLPLRYIVQWANAPLQSGFFSMHLYQAMLGLFDAIGFVG
jgi:hypothetical protein